jgi:hypothetical protein
MSSPTSVTLNNSNKSSSSAAPPDFHIRNKLLHKLGIHGSHGSSPPSDITGPKVPPAAPPMHNSPLSAAQIRRDRILRGMGVGYTLQSLPPDGSAVRNPLQGVKPVTEPLKSTADADVERGTSSVSTSAGSSDGTPRKTRIMFEEQVQVMPIPTRYEYSERIKSRIWSNRHELQENAERNAVEFAAEGWNWRTVTEDDGTLRFFWLEQYFLFFQLTMQFLRLLIGMYICSQSGELVHPIHLKHLTMNQPSNEESMEHGAPVEMYDDGEEEDDDEVQDAGSSYSSLTRGKPVDRS